MKHHLLAVTAMTGSLLFSTSVLAQSAPPQNTAADQVAEESADPSTILVTGSRIRRPNLEANSPITTITGEQFFETGQLSVGDTLNELPQLRNTFSQQNSTRFLGTRGLNLLDLYGGVT